MISFTCLLNGEQPELLFEVSVPDNGRVHELKDAIKEKRYNALHNVAHTVEGDSQWLCFDVEIDACLVQPACTC